VLNWTWKLETENGKRSRFNHSISAILLHPSRRWSFSNSRLRNWDAASVWCTNAHTSYCKGAKINRLNGGNSQYCTKCQTHLQIMKNDKCPHKKGLGFSFFVFLCPLLVKSGSKKTTFNNTRFLPNGFCGALKSKWHISYFYFLRLFIACGFGK